MAFPDNNIDVADIKTTLGYAPDDLRALFDNEHINIYSFYSPIDLEPDFSSKLIVRKPKTDEWNGDFRRYNHAAAAPKLYNTSLELGYLPGAQVLNVGFRVDHEEVNLKAVNAAISHMKVKFYSNSSRTNLFFTSDLIPITWQAVTPPPGAYKDQTQKPTSSQVITGIEMPNPALYPYVWFDVWVCTNAGAEILHYPTWRGTIQINEFVLPTVQVTTNNATLPPGYTAIFFTKTAETISGTSLTLTGKLQGIPSGGSTPVDLSGQVDFVEVYGGTDYNLYLNKTYTAGVESGFNATLSRSYNYGEVIQLKMNIDSIT